MKSRNPQTEEERKMAGTPSASALKGEEESKSAEALPSDVIAEILSHLPVKPLLRFKIVSKPFLALIESSSFAKLHYSQSVLSQTPKLNSNYYSNRLLTVRSDSHLYTFDLDSFETTNLLSRPLVSKLDCSKLIGESQGLLCVAVSVNDPVLYIPCTQVIYKLPKPESYEPSKEFPFGRFAVFGFGYDNVSDDYKLLRIVQFYGRIEELFHSEVQVYSFKLNLWKRVDVIPYYLKYEYVSGVLCNHAFHWVGTATRGADSNDDLLIVGVNVHDQAYSILEQPDFGEDESSYVHLSVLGGCLCLSRNCNPLKVRSEIWVMKEYGRRESWTKLFSMVHIEFFGCFGHHKPISYSTDRRKVLLQHNNMALYWYDMAEKKVENIVVQGMPAWQFEGMICFGSLFSLDLIEELIGSDVRRDGKKQTNALVV